MSREITLMTEKAKLEKKFVKNMGDKDAAEFVTKLENMSKEELNKYLLDLAKTHQGIINTRNSDGDLRSLKNEVREKSAVYNDQLRSNKDLTRFTSLMISDKFGDDLMDQQVPEDAG